MGLFNVEKKKISLTAYLPIFLLVVVLGFFVAFSEQFSKTNLEHEKQILGTAIERSLTQCYALEGTYPAAIAHLEENYGLTYNKAHFYIDYIYIGGNLRPDITIIERE